MSQSRIWVLNWSLWVYLRSEMPTHQASVGPAVTSPQATSMTVRYYRRALIRARQNSPPAEVELHSKRDTYFHASGLNDVVLAPRHTQRSDLGNEARLRICLVTSKTIYRELALQEGEPAGYRLATINTGKKSPVSTTLPCSTFASRF